MTKGKIDMIERYKDRQKDGKTDRLIDKQISKVDR